MTGGRHDWVVLDSEEAHAQVVGDFVADGVRRGEVVLLAGLGAREERLWSRLRRAGLVGEGWTPSATTPVWVVPPDPQRLPGEVARAVAEGWPGIRVSGALTGPGVAPFEAVVAELDPPVPLTVLCPYFRRLLGPGDRELLEPMHDGEVDATAEYDDGVFRLVRDGDVLHLAGELDSGNADALRAVLRSSLRSDGAPATWDVADLRFLDVGAADALVAAAAGPPGLTLRGASRLTGRLVGLVADRYPGRAVVLAESDGDTASP
ncbi:MEDS domain-containing protein [Geodermatophilus sp. FMUSA9-8]|uniref:MEDS domain-containing protein n=1 Tax=Geodermatophilus sp. FMUSA9-8 TaxID=3120155 RepID=UPI00300B6C0A